MVRITFNDVLEISRYLHEVKMAMADLGVKHPDNFTTTILLQLHIGRSIAEAAADIAESVLQRA
jgi:hypothetical protein